MTFAEILSSVYEDTGYAASPATAIVTRIKNYVNAAHRAILREPGLMRLRHTAGPLKFTSVSGQALYGLPPAITQVIAVTETDNDRLLNVMSLMTLRTRDPGLSQSGTPYALVPLGYKPTKAVPDNTGLWASSSSASDTGGPTIEVNGLRASGEQTGDQGPTALTGVTRVAIGTLTDFSDITRITLSAVCVGRIGVYDSATVGTELSIIPIGQTTTQYFMVQLYPTPSSAIEYSVDGLLTIPTLDDNNDVPLLPDEFHDLLVAYARGREWQHHDDTRYPVAMAEFARGLSRLKHHVSSQPGELPVMGDGRPAKFSREGSWAPATWS